MVLVMQLVTYKADSRLGAGAVIVECVVVRYANS